MKPDPAFKDGTLASVLLLKSRVTAGKVLTAESSVLRSVLSYAHNVLSV